MSQFEDIFYASVIYAYYHKMHIQSHARKTETSGVHFFILKISFSKRIKNVKNKKKLGKKGFTTQFRGQKIMVNRVMNIESVTNSIEHVFKQKTW